MSIEKKIGEYLREAAARDPKLKDLDKRIDKLEDEIENVLDDLQDAFDEIQSNWSSASGMMYEMNLDYIPEVQSNLKLLIKVANDLITKVDNITNLEAMRQKINKRLNK
jgi:uncharacterized protein YukE